MPADTFEKSVLTLAFGVPSPSLIASVPQKLVNQAAPHYSPLPPSYPLPSLPPWERDEIKGPVHDGKNRETSQWRRTLVLQHGQLGSSYVGASWRRKTKINQQNVVLIRRSLRAVTEPGTARGGTRKDKCWLEFCREGDPQNFSKAMGLLGVEVPQHW